MIKRKVVLVLGAGASMPFQFPSGHELKMQLIEKLNGNPMRSRLLAAGIANSQVAAFRDTLYMSGQPSVDAFLEYRNEFIDIGKLAMACTLLPLESEDILFRKQSWYDYLFNKLRTTFDNFLQNTVSVLTFNYDRSLEHYLFKAMCNTYGKHATC